MGGVELGGGVWTYMYIPLSGEFFAATSSLVKTLDMFAALGRSFECFEVACVEESGTAAESNSSGVDERAVGLGGVAQEIEEDGF